MTTMDTRCGFFIPTYLKNFVSERAELNTKCNMKRTLFSLMFAAMAFIFSCDNKPDTDCIEVRMLANVCGNAVLQVVDTGLDMELGSWTDFNDDTTYENVFGTFLDPCIFDNLPDGKDETFLVKITDKRSESNCVVCLALLADMPDEFYFVENAITCDPYINF